VLSESEFFDTVRRAEKLWLFLDYDGTLSEFSRTPDRIEPRREVAQLLRRLIAVRQIRLAVVSGRPLSILEKLLPVSGLILAGTYGIEIRDETGETISRDSFEEIRPTIEEIKSTWQSLIGNGEGLQIEDKRWSVAMHARWADDELGEKAITGARRAATVLVDPDRFRILGGHRFLEVAPLEANKGKTVEYLLAKYPPGNDLYLYFGDDDKDEEAFAVIDVRGGIPVVVAPDSRPTKAHYRLDSPKAVRECLNTILMLFHDQ
jgi:trehalose-phosphatase